MPQSASPGEGEQSQLEAGPQPEPEPEPQAQPEPEPEPAAPGHQLDVDMPMAQWSATQVAAWIADVLGLPDDSEAVTALREDFEALVLEDDDAPSVWDARR